MNEIDRSLRNTTYEMFVELGRAPTVRDVAERLTRSEEEVAAGWRRLHVAHALVLHDSADEIHMANPFSAVPTAHRVRALDRWWFANCAWDAFGVLAVLDADGRIETSCFDCGAPLAIEVEGRRPDNDALLFHCLVPASSWWDDIAFT